MKKRDYINDREFRIFLPKQYDGKKITKKQLSGVLKKVSNRFGGATVFDATGTWNDFNGKNITEPVWVISADRDSEHTRNYRKVLAGDRKFMKKLALELGAKYNQDVMFETRDRVEVEQYITKRQNLKKVA